jgi:hypothetical protein
MRPWTILLPMMVFSAVASAACNGPIVRDWGLHLQWMVEQDCEHPERPARLVEVPWTVEMRASATGGKITDPRPVPEVRPGMMVTLCHRSDEADIHLRGTALGTARTGENVRVKTGLGSIPLDGIVRGPGLVELVPRRGGS